MALRSLFGSWCVLRRDKLGDLVAALVKGKKLRRAGCPSHAIRPSVFPCGISGVFLFSRRRCFGKLVTWDGGSEVPGRLHPRPN